MKCLNNMFVIAMLTFVAGVGNAIAEESMAPPSFYPLEIYTCNFHKGKNMDDLARVSKKWNAWMDKSDGPAYSAYNLVPLFYSEEISFDVAWLGVWPDGVTMGAGIKHWLSKGKGMQAEFSKVVSCNTTSNFATLTITPPKESESIASAEFSNCKVKEGRTVKEAVGAIREWVKYREDSGSDVARWLFFPAYGESSDADYDFKWVTGFPSYDSFGRAYDQFGTGGGYRKYNEIFGRVMTCDTARFYDVTTVRVSEE
jgi:hypothetical protein